MYRFPSGPGGEEEQREREQEEDDHWERKERRRRRREEGEGDSPCSEIELRPRHKTRPDVNATGPHRQLVVNTTIPDRDKEPQKRAVPSQTRRSNMLHDRAVEVFLRAFLQMIALNEYDIRRNQSVMEDVMNALNSRGLTAFVYGSMRTGVCLPSSDFDFYIAEHTAARSQPSSQSSGDVKRPSLISDQLSTPVVPVLSSSRMAMMSRRERQAFASRQLHNLVGILRSDRRFDRIQKIAHANVPIVKCVHKHTGTEIDFSFTPDGVDSSEYLNRRMKEDVCFLARSLIILVKSMLTEWRLNDPSVGGLGSFPVSLMVLWFLESEGSQYNDTLRHSVFVNLVGFLKYYGEDFDYRNLAIDVGRGGTFAKPCTTELMLMNPLEPTRNAAKACSKFGSEIRRKFAEAYQMFMALSTLSAADVFDNKNASKKSIGQLFGKLMGRTVAKNLNDSGRAIAVETNHLQIVDALIKFADAEVRGTSSSQHVAQHKWNTMSMYVGGNLD